MKPVRGFILKQVDVVYKMKNDMVSLKVRDDLTNNIWDRIESGMNMEYEKTWHGGPPSWLFRIGDVR